MASQPFCSGGRSKKRGTKADRRHYTESSVDGPDVELPTADASAAKGSSFATSATRQLMTAGREAVEQRAYKLSEQLRRAIAKRSRVQSTTSADSSSGDDADEVDGPGQSQPLAAGLAAQIDDMVLLCSICLDCYREPKVLPCQHTYCRECLETVLGAQAQKSYLICPECRMEVTLPVGGVRNLTTNFLVNKLVDLLQSFRADEARMPSASAMGGVTDDRRVSCDLCSEDTVAVAMCRECEQSMCDRHHGDHGRYGATRSHTTTLLPAVGLTTADGGALTAAAGGAAESHDAEQTPWSLSSLDTAEKKTCDPTDHKQTELWCTGCSTFVCLRCSEPVHRAHNVTPVSLAILEQKTSLEDDLSQLSRMMTNAETSVSMLDECQAAVEAEGEEVTFAVHTCFQRLIDSFAARRSLLMEEIALEKTARCKTLRLQKEELLFQVGNMRTSAERIRATVDKSDETEILRGGQELRKQMKNLLTSQFQLSPQVCQGVSFDTSWEETVLQSVHRVARANFTHVSPSLCTASGSGLEGTMTRGNDVTVDVMVVDSNGEPSDHPNDQVTVVVYPPSASSSPPTPSSSSSNQPGPPSSLTATSPRSRSSMLSSSSSTSSSDRSSLSSSSAPSSLSSSQRVSLARQPLVATKSSQAGRKGHYSAAYVPNEEGEYTVEVCVNGWPIRGSPFVAKVVPGRAYSSVAVTTFGKQGKGEGMFRSPHGVAVDNQELVHVADMLNNRIQVFNHLGGFIRSFGGKGPNPGQFVEPMGVAVDDDGHVVVADYGNHRLQVLRHNGQSIRTIGSRGTTAGKFALPFDVAAFCHPTIGLCYAVTEFENNRVQVLQSDGVPVLMFGTKGNGPGQFLNPAGIAVSEDLLLYVADHNNHRVQVFTVSGEFQAAFGQHGTAAGDLDRPCGVAIDRLGNVLVSEFTNGRVQVFSPDGFSPIATLGSPSQLHTPTGIAVDKRGSVYVCSEHRITVF